MSTLKMTDPPLVSIIMTTRNAEQYISSTIESILAQSYQNWELVITNNQSTDHTLSKIKEFAKKDARIRYFTNPGIPEIIQGLRFSFTNSHGLLITRMDSDDIMHPEKLGSLSDLLINHGPGHMAIGCVKHFSQKPLGGGFKRYDRWLNGLIRENRSFTEVYRECVIPSSCWMVYREDFIQCGAFGGSSYPEDYDLCFRFYQKQIGILRDNRILHYWRDHPQRVSRVDRRYQDQLYYPLKLFYFLRTDYRPDYQLVIWGAGTKGKKLAAELKSSAMRFRWVCNNPKKIGKDIYGIQLESTQILSGTNNLQVLVAFSETQDYDARIMCDTNSNLYYWFC